VNRLQGEVKRLQAELKDAVQKIREQDIKIKRFSEWQLADQYLSEDAVLKDTIEQQKLRYTQVHEQEAKKMADAA
jgi:hypothetical protein